MVDASPSQPMAAQPSSQPKAPPGGTEANPCRAGWGLTPRGAAIHAAASWGLLGWPGLAWLHLVWLTLAFSWLGLAVVASPNFIWLITGSARYTMILQ